jgi:hypothetical protein
LLGDKIQVGINDVIDWSKEYSRFTFLSSFNQMTIVPALHRNTIAFIGMGKKSKYLCTKRIKQKFIALDNKNQLFCWSIVTGKLISTHRLPVYRNYSDFKIF